jgi:hypothetical protein
MSEAKFAPGEGSLSTCANAERPLTRLAATRRATLSHKGRVHRALGLILFDEIVP